MFLPAQKRHQYTQQRARIQPVRLCTPRPAIDQDRRRVEHTVVDATPDQEPVQPEAVTACLVAGDDLRRPAEPPRSLHQLLFDQRHQLVRIASLDAIDADLIGYRRVQGDNPRCLAQLQRNEKLRLECSRNGKSQAMPSRLDAEIQTVGSA